MQCCENRLSCQYITDVGQSKCRAERNQALEQAKRPHESMFVPECNEDGTFAQVCLCNTTHSFFFVFFHILSVSVDSSPVTNHNFTDFKGTHYTKFTLSGFRLHILASLECLLLIKSQFKNSVEVFIICQNLELYLRISCSNNITVQESDVCSTHN